jgi:uncharacterized membrane protein YraQ (UPF0718 family)
MIKIVTRYKFFILFLFFNIVLSVFLPEIGKKTFEINKRNLLEMMSIIPPIFILLGLLDVWVERETMMKYMGEKSGIKGGIIAFIIGSAAAGPLYAAFPIAGILIKKGVKLTNVFIFLGAWSTTKIPMILFETSNLGLKYMLLRLLCNIIGIIIIAIIMEKTTSENEKEIVYKISMEK